MKHANLIPLVGETWIWPLGRGFDHFKSEIVPFLEKEIKAGKAIFPQVHNIFRALKEVPFESVRVVILGQD